MQVVRQKGYGALTAQSIAEVLGTSTRPVFTCFETMERVRTEVYERAAAVYDGYIEAGLRERIPFFGAGMQYIRFAREEPELYRLLFLSRSGEYDTMKAMRHMQELVRPALTDIYGITGYLFSGYVACGAQPVHADSYRRLPVFRPRDRRNIYGAKRKHIQGDKGDTGLCRRDI